MAPGKLINVDAGFFAIIGCRSTRFTAEGWHVAYPDLTVAEIHRLKRIGKAVEEFLDKIG